MFDTTLAPKTKDVLLKLQKTNWISSFYLAGGTALALQYGHRISIDLDWFTQKKIDTAGLLKKISAIGQFTLRNEEENTLEGTLDDVKLSFMTYPYQQLNPTLEYKPNIILASPEDIAVMKIGAIASRNTKKDFIDLFTFLNNEQTSLNKLLGRMQEKFGSINYDLYHLYKSLTYFSETDKEPMPKMITNTDWAEVKKFFIKEVKKIKI